MNEGCLSSDEAGGIDLWVGGIQTKDLFLREQINISSFQHLDCEGG